MKPFSVAALIIIVLSISYFSQGVQILSPYSGAWAVIRDSQLNSKSFLLPGLQENVEVTFDASGMAHIKASNDHDLFFAQGFVSAYNRLDQMELQALLASGNLSKVIGEAGVPSDRAVMTIGLPYNAYILEKNLKADYPGFYSLLEAFSEGVNSYINSKYYTPPLLFKLGNIRPFDWSPYYSLAWQEYMSWTLTTGAIESLDYSLLYSSAGFNTTILLWPYYPYYTQNVTVVPGDGEVNNLSLSKRGVSPSYLWSLNWMDEWATGVNPGLLKQLAPLIRNAIQNISDPYFTYFAEQFVGSNSWVITRNLSSSPMLANDPHLPLYVPSLWIPMQLQDPNFNVTGWELAGEPGILIGHTERTAWGLTTSEGNSANMYLEVLNGSSYLFEGKWYPMIQVNYSLQGKEYIVFYTNNGPIVARDNNYGIALNWAASYGNSYDLLAELMLDNSTNYQQMLDALRFWGSPPQNFAMVSDQHAGYITAGLYPVINEILPNGKHLQVIGSRSLLNGTVENWEPSGVVPFQYLPQAMDPARGFIFAPNQPTVGEDYPYPFIGGFWDSGGRAQAILSYITSHTKFDLKDMMLLQSNITDYWASQLSPLFVNAIKGNPLNQAEKTALQHLKDWSYTADVNSVGMTIYWYTLSEFDNMTYGRLYKQLGLTLPYPFPSTTIYLALNEPDSSIFNGSFSASALSAFKAAVSLLNSSLGSNISLWSWGRVHMLLISSVSGIHQLSIGPIPIWGDSYTLSVAGTEEGLVVPEHYVTVGSSLRFIASPATQQFYGVFPGGLSGNYLSEYYSNQLETWVEHNYYSMGNQSIVARWNLH